MTATPPPRIPDPDPSKSAQGALQPRHFGLLRVAQAMRSCKELVVLLWKPFQEKTVLMTYGGWDGYGRFSMNLCEGLWQVLVLRLLLLVFKGRGFFEGTTHLPFVIGRPEDTKPPTLFRQEPDKTRRTTHHAHHVSVPVFRSDAEAATSDTRPYPKGFRPHEAVPNTDLKYRLSSCPVNQLSYP